MGPRWFFRTKSFGILLAEISFGEEKNETDEELRRFKMERAINALVTAVLVMILIFFLCATAGLGLIYGPIAWGDYVRPVLVALLIPAPAPPPEAPAPEVVPPTPPAWWYWPAPWAAPPAPVTPAEPGGCDAGLPPEVPQGFKVQLDQRSCSWIVEPTEAPKGITEEGAEEGRDLPPVEAGGEDFALGIEALDDGWLRLREAANRSYCAWALQFKLTLGEGIQAQFPHCIELRLTGTGTAVFKVRPDSIGYSTSDTQGTGLAWWPAGVNGRYRVDGGPWVDLSTGPEGVNFPLSGGQRTIDVQLEGGYVAIPLGEIRNNVLPIH